MAVLYIVAGMLHFLKPKMYLRIMPPWIPAPALMVFLSGVAEVVLGVALLFPATQALAAWGIILLLVAVFPANIYMFKKGGATFRMSDRMLFWRLPIQLLLILWAYWFT